MKTSRFQITLGLAFTAAFTFSLAVRAQAQTLTTLYDFGSERDATNPGGLIRDAGGNFYGNSVYGGTRGEGTVFQLSPPSEAGGNWTETILYSFQGGSDGAQPFGPLSMDKNGNLYGVTAGGGNQDEVCYSNGCGTVFEISPPADPGGTWTERLLYRFSSSGGWGPAQGVILDSRGNLYGTTLNGGRDGQNAGTIFRLTPTNGTWVAATLYSFGIYDKAGYSAGPLKLDAAGNLYGATGTSGIANAGGSVFRLSPPSKSGAQWTLTILFTPLFQGTSSAWVTPPILMGSDGAIYGTTYYGGNGNGIVYKLNPPASPGGQWEQTILYAFPSALHGNPNGGVVGDPKTNVLYGTTIGGDGTVFQLTPPTQSGDQWTYTLLHAFTNTGDGWAPDGVVPDGSGNLYGLTDWGGTSTYGTFFELTK
jgi:uncharacterized repeat protein (TIGR03803 family)